MRNVGRTLFEVVVVVVLGCAFGLGANAASKKGLSIDRDYFPKSVKTPVPGTQPAPHVATSSPDTPSSQPAASSVDVELMAEGLQPIHLEEVEKAFRDPSRDAGLYVFVDARNDEHFEAAHIPGALQFDRYRPEAYLPAVMAAVQPALKVIVYCGGGQCEDSKFAAMELRNQGLDPSKIFVYVGGIKEWTARELPTEQGRKQ